MSHWPTLCNMAIPIWKETRKKNVAYLACTIEAGKREKKGMSFEEANLSFHTLPDLSIELPTDSSASPLGFFKALQNQHTKSLNHDTFSKSGPPPGLSQKKNCTAIPPVIKTGNQDCYPWGSSLLSHTQASTHTSDTLPSLVDVNF